MAPPRLSQLQKQILRWLWADEQRTHGGTSSSHHELLQALPGDKSNISRSLRTLERTFRTPLEPIDFPRGGFSPPEGRLARGCKPPAFSRFLFQSAVESAETF